MRFGRLVSLLAPLVAAACATSSAPERAGPSLASHVVYLAFSDGAEGIARGGADDATRGVTALCEADAFAAWQTPDECAGGDPDACREAIRAGVAAHFAAYDVAFTLVRPSEGPFSMVVIAPPHVGCTFGQRGAALADCESRNAASVGFVFDCYGDAASCAVLVAHEVGHGFGLVHSADPSDIMTPAPDDPRLAFRDEVSAVDPNPCGITSQSSHRALVAALGARRGPRREHADPRRPDERVTER
jgi:hypothetical protein